MAAAWKPMNACKLAWPGSEISAECIKAVTPKTLEVEADLSCNSHAELEISTSSFPFFKGYVKLSAPNADTAIYPSSEPTSLDLHTAFVGTTSDARLSFFHQLFLRRGQHSDYHALISSISAMAFPRISMTSPESFGGTMTVRSKSKQDKHLGNHLNNSLTRNKAVLGMIPFTNHDYSEVAEMPL